MVYTMIYTMVYCIWYIPWYISSSNCCPLHQAIAAVRPWYGHTVAYSMDIPWYIPWYIP